jgi:hypothetical protein
LPKGRLPAVVNSPRTQLAIGVGTPPTADVDRGFC